MYFDYFIIQKLFMNNNIFELFISNLKKAFKGRRIWIDLIKKHNITDKDYIILMPSLNRDYNYFALLYINQFLEQKKYNKIIILTFDNRVMKCCSLFSDKINKAINFSRENSELIMKYYCLYKFTDKLIFASLKEPKGRNDYNLIGRNGITLEEIFAIGIYGNKSFKKEQQLEYTGNDSEILSFIYDK